MAIRSPLEVGDTIVYATCRPAKVTAHGEYEKEKALWNMVTCPKSPPQTMSSKSASDPASNAYTATIRLPLPGNPNSVFTSALAFAAYRMCQSRSRGHGLT